MIFPVFKRTKILATIGPASDSEEMIEKLLSNGVNGCRFNFSHGDYPERERQLKTVRQISKTLGKPVAVIQDLQGPKIRLGEFNDDQPFPVKAGDELILEYQGQFNGRDIIPVQYNLAPKVKIGEKVYIFDGKVKSEVIEIVTDKAIKIKIKNDGVIRQKKGLNLPDTDMAGDILTTKDLRDIEFGATQDYDYVALSFVQSAEDIQNLRQILLSYNSDAHIIAKIETKQAIASKNLEAIVEASDGIMVARGDLAVEAGAEVVPVVQKKLIELCQKHGKLVIVATQMMGSMVSNPQPSRAEASDVANAVMQGADCVMLSDETANGQYPLETVKEMKKIILYTQKHSVIDNNEGELTEHSQKLNIIAKAAVAIARQLDATALVVETKSGVTAAHVASARPNRVILSVTDSERTAQQLSICYANQAYVRPSEHGIGFKLASELKQAGRFGKIDQASVVIVSGRQAGVTGGTDTVRVRVV